MELKDEGQDVWCPNCRRLMVQLAKYEPTPLDTMPGVDSPDATDFAIGIAEEKVAFSLIVNLIGYFRFLVKRKRVARLKRKWLNEFPNTLICPSCLTLLPRK